MQIIIILKYPPHPGRCIPATGGGGFFIVEGKQQDTFESGTRHKINHFVGGLPTN